MNTQLAMRFARKLCIKRIVRKLQKYGCARVRTTWDDGSERAAVDEALRAEQRKARLR